MDVVNQTREGKNPSQSERVRVSRSLSSAVARNSFEPRKCGLILHTSKNVRSQGVKYASSNPFGVSFSAKRHTTYLEASRPPIIMLKSVLKMAPQSLSSLSSSTAESPSADAHVVDAPVHSASTSTVDSPNMSTWTAFSRGSPDDADIGQRGKITLHERGHIDGTACAPAGLSLSADRPLCSPSRHVGTCFKCKLSGALAEACGTAPVVQESGKAAEVVVDNAETAEAADDYLAASTVPDAAPTATSSQPPPAVGTYTIAEYMAAAACRPLSPQARRDSGSSFASKTSLKPIVSGQALQELELSDEERCASGLPSSRFITAPTASFDSLAALGAEAAAAEEVSEGDGHAPREPQELYDLAHCEEESFYDDDGGLFI